MMDKGCHSSGESAAGTTATNTTISSSSSNNKDQNQYQVKQLNKFSHKISKPPIRKPSFDHHQPPLGLDETQSQPSNLQQQQHQPPVYNINKSDFRDVVQKLTGSPAHERLPPAAPPPSISQPRPPSSRLQRIRPPPLENLTNRPPPLLNDAVVRQNPNNNTISAATAVGNSFFGGQRQLQPLSPLPPFPTVHATAESPISAYMRYLQNSSTAFTQPPPPPPLQQQQNELVRPSTSTSVQPLQFPAGSSPLPFGCLPSPKSPYPLLSPSLLFSPTNQFGFQQFPLSPTTLPVPSPRWKGL